MGKRMKKVTRAGAGALAGVMVFGLAAPLAPLSVQAADEKLKNLALNATATQSEVENGTEFNGGKAIDGVVDRDTKKSRWATNTHGDMAPQWLKIDLKEKKTFQSFVIAWERRNITGYKIQISETGEDNSWKDVYTKTDKTKIANINENIRLDKPETARYVRLLIDGYTPEAEDDSIQWQSVSIYDFQIYADAIPEDNLPGNNYCLGATAETSNFEETAQNPGSQNAAKAIDGDLETRWATENDGKGTTERVLTVKLPKAQWVKYLKINWEMPQSGKPTPKKYTIEVKDSEKGQYKTVHTNSEQVTTAEQIIELKEGTWAKEIQLKVSEYGPAVGDWYNVSVAEFGAYAVKPGTTPEIPPVNPPVEPESSELQKLADSIEAPKLNGDNTKLTWDTPEGVKVEFLADYEQVVGRDGTIYQPLTDTTIKGVYKVTKTEDGADKAAEVAKGKTYVESTLEHTIKIPGKYKENGANAKPAIVPELAEWYGGEKAGNVEISGKIVVDPSAAELKTVADTFAKDYSAALGKKMTVETGSNPAAGDIYFTLDKKDNGLGEEGYLMETDSSIKVTVSHKTGAFWATQSILQIAELNEGKLPKGTTRDYPKYKVRGFMLDVARKPISMETLKDVAKEMAYYKMNALHLHLNDNLIFYEDFATTEEAREKAYTGFRLESDIRKGGNEGKNKADLTNEDMYYTKEEFRKFILDCRDMGIDIIPEFDTPGHSGAFTKVRPDLMLQKTMEGNAKRAGEQFDLSDAKYADSLAFVQSVWNEYLNENMFDDSMTVHIGTDEYYGEANCFRKFTDDMVKYLKNKGYTVRMWGSLTNKKENQPDAYPVDGEGVQLNIWSEGYADPKDMYGKGYELINTLEGHYIVPAAGYYNDYVNGQSVYKNWEPNKYSKVTLPAGSDQVLGGTYAIWNDSIDTRANGISEMDVYDRFAKALPAFASKNWGDGSDKEWNEVKEIADKLGDAANSNPYHKASVDKDGKYFEYKFEDKNDSSENKRNLELAGSAKLEKGALKLAGGESYATTPIDKLATGNTLEFDITLDKDAKAGQILFETDHEGGNDNYVHDIRLMEDGRLGFRRELYDYYFDYKLPVGQKVHLAIRTDATKTYLSVNGQEMQAVGVYRNRQTDPEGKPRKEGVAISTLLLPIQRIGSKTNAVKAEIDNVVVTNKAPEMVQVDKTKWSGKASSAHKNVGNEGTFEMAFDSNPKTHWHSNYDGNKQDLILKDTLGKEKGKLESVTGEINFDKGYEINKISFTPRTDANSGIITKADLFVKNEAKGEWIQVAKDQTFANNQSKKTVIIDPQTVWGIKMVVKQSSDGWVAVSEFDVAAPQNCNVIVEAQTGGTVEGAVKEALEGSKTTVKAKAKKGYDFAGWYDMITGQKVSDDAEYTFTVTTNTSLIAHFTRNGETPDPQPTEWTVTIDGKEYKVNDGEKLERPEDPKKDGYRFLGWFVGDEEFDFNTPITSDLAIEARFEKIEEPGKPEEPEKPGKPEGQEKPEKPGKPGGSKGEKVEGAVQTGDASSALPWVVGIGAAAGAGAIVLGSRKKTK